MSKTAVITGASRGIGAKTAITLAKKGYNVALIYKNNENKMQEVLAEISHFNIKAISYKCDISNHNEVKNLTNSIIKDFKSIDILVNNAGISSYKLFQDTTFEEWNEIFSVNVTGAFNLTKEILPLMISQKYGRIVNISSIWGETGASCEVAYSTSKAAIIGFTKALSKEVAPSNITVNCVSPGVIKTDMISSFSAEDLAILADETPVGRLGTPADISRVIEFLIDEKSDFITGQVFSINGGFLI